MTSSPSNTLTRRGALAATGMALAAPALISQRVGAGDVTRRNKLYVQLRGNLNQSDGLWAYTGAYWGQPTGEIARQLFRVDGLSFNALALRADGGVTQKMIECGFWQDPKTGQLADEWINPMNGLLCKPIHFKSSQTVSFDHDGRQEVSEDRLNDGQQIEGYIDNPIVDGPIVWSQERLFMKLNRPTAQPGTDPLTYTGPISTVTSLATYRAEVGELDRDFVPTTMQFQSLSGWYSWMRMGQRAGTCSFELVGRKLQNKNEIPKRVSAFLNERYPGFVEHPWA